MTRLRLVAPLFPGRFAFQRFLWGDDKKRTKIRPCECPPPASELLEVRSVGEAEE